MTRKWLILCSLSTPDEERKRGKENGRRSKSIQLGLTSLRLSVGHEGTPYNNGCYQPHDYQKEREREREREEKPCLPIKGHLLKRALQRTHPTHMTRVWINDLSTPLTSSTPLVCCPCSSISIQPALKKC